MKPDAMSPLGTDGVAQAITAAAAASDWREVRRLVPHLDESEERGLSKLLIPAVRTIREKLRAEAWIGTVENGAGI